MSESAQDTADRDAFFAELGRVFDQYRQVSEGYGVYNAARLAEMVGGQRSNKIGIGEAGNGRAVMQFSENFPNPIADKLGDECVFYAPTLGEVGIEWECITYLTS